ncbi:MAG TPA: metallophosphoesterase family protein [Devosiaceae bacterium]|nr:metallophosphoesterase family protein [Devosiaceae bacterium]
MFQEPRRPRLQFDEWPAAVYAIGDVHGCIDQLRLLEAGIVADAAAMPGEKWIVTLGDYIDRGAASPAVLDHIMSPAPPGFRRIALIGNHEQLLLDFLDNPPASLEWLQWGGLETAAAYGLTDPRQEWRRSPQRFAAALQPLIPARHLELLGALPTCLSLPGFFFVHAGIRPGVPLEAQEDDDLIWIRAPFLRAKFGGQLIVVHGHTPVDAVEIVTGRIDIDTGCFFSGVLTALRVLPDGSTKILQARGAPANYSPVGDR